MLIVGLGSTSSSTTNTPPPPPPITEGADESPSLDMGQEAARYSRIPVPDSSPSSSHQGIPGIHVQWFEKSTVARREVNRVFLPTHFELETYEGTAFVAQQREIFPVAHIEVVCVDADIFHRRQSALKLGQVADKSFLPSPAETRRIDHHQVVYFAKDTTLGLLRRAHQATSSCAGALSCAVGPRFRPVRPGPWRPRRRTVWFAAVPRRVAWPPGPCSRRDRRRASRCRTTP